MKDEQGRSFKKPLFQTFSMFAAMAFCLIPYSIQRMMDDHKRKQRAMQKQYERVHLQQPGTPSKRYYGDQVEEDEPEVGPEATSWRMVFLLALPALSDCIASVLLKLGLLFVTSSVYQLMCCLRIIFVAVNKQIFLGQTLAPYMWVGIITNACAITLISASSILGKGGDSSANPGEKVRRGTAHSCNPPPTWCTRQPTPGHARPRCPIRPRADSTLACNHDRTAAR